MTKPMTKPMVLMPSELSAPETLKSFLLSLALGIQIACPKCGEIKPGGQANDCIECKGAGLYESFPEIHPDHVAFIYAKAVQNLSQPVPDHGWHDAIRAFMELASSSTSWSSEQFSDLWLIANSLLDQQPKPENQESELDRCIDDYKKLWAVSPYDVSDNLAAHTGAFAFYIQNKYSAEIRDIAEDFIKADKRKSEWKPLPGDPE